MQVLTMSYAHLSMVSFFIIIFVAALNSIQLLRPFIKPPAVKYLDICESSLSYLNNLVNDTLDLE
jgi:hypothetical protein